MTETDTRMLRELLEREQRKLDLIMTIDGIRDSAQDPASMLGAIVNCLTDEFDAELCLLLLIDRDTGDLELRALNDRSNRFGRLSAESLRGLAQRAMRADSVDIWDGPGVCTALGIEGDSCPMQMAVVRLSNVAKNISSLTWF